ncbi:MAG: DUF5688 family protein [Lachnospira sp.]
MEYPKFIDEVKDRVSHLAGEDGTVTINHVIKNNGCELDGLVIMRKGYNISPTIYLNSFYEEFLSNGNLDVIINKITRLYESNKDRNVVNPDRFVDYTLMKETIVYKLVNFNKNKKLLKLIPHRKFLDLAIVYYCLLDQTKDGNATALVYNTNLSKWNVTEQDLYDAAVENTPKLLPPKLFSMNSIIKDLMPEEEELELGDMYVLTNRCKINGAASIIYDGVLKRIADRMEKDLYVLPSSIHEVIILPKVDFYNKTELCKMVKEVNCEGVAKEEILADSVYTFLREENQLVL